MKQLSVLIIEDSFYSADLTVRELKKAGFQIRYRMVASAKSLFDALEEKWDLIISDNSMPNFNALQALTIRNSAASDTPFIIVSEDISREDVDTAFKQGCCAFVQKEHLPVLRSTVKDILDN